MHSLTQLTPTVFSDPAASPPPDCVQTTLDTALLITPPETDFSPYLMVKCQDLVFIKHLKNSKTLLRRLSVLLFLSPDSLCIDYVEL